MVVAGQKLTAAQYNTDIKGGTVLKRGRRETNSSTTSTEVGVLRVDSALVTLGRHFLVTTNSVGLDASVANDGARLNLRYTTDGSAASTSSTLLELAQWKLPDIAHSENFTVSAVYIPASSHALSVLLCVARSSGTGVIGALGDPTFPIDLLIWDIGEDPGNTGVSI